MNYFDLPSAAMAPALRALTTTPASAVETVTEAPQLPPHVEAEQLLARLRAAVACVEAQVRLFQEGLAGSTGSAGSVGSTADTGWQTFTPNERVQLRSAPPVASDPALIVDLASREVRVEGRVIEVTHIEFELLAFLQTHALRSFSRSHLLQDVWGFSYDGSARTVDVHVARLRKKLGAAGKQIETVRGHGYRWRPPAVTAAAA